MTPRLYMTLKEPLAIFPKMLDDAGYLHRSRQPARELRPESVGSGPWKFVEWRHDDYMRFAKNPDYFEGRRRRIR